MKALVLAAGRGNRINDITKGENKCLLKVNGKAVIEYNIENISSLKDINEIAVVVGYRSEDVMETLGREINGLKINYCVQRKQKGLIDAMESAKEVLNGDDFMLVLGDEFIVNNNYKDAIEKFKKNGNHCMIGTIEVDDINLVRRTYTFKYDKNKNLVDFIEKPKKPYNNIMGTGNVFFSGSILKLLDDVPVNPIRGEKELVDLFNLILDYNGKISTFTVGDKYINLNTKDDYLALNSLINGKKFNFN